MRKDAWKIAIETLSWIEMQKISEQMAFAKAIDQMKIKESNTIRFAYGLVIETIRRKNLIDEVINFVLYPETINRFNFGLQSFLRLFVYQNRVVKNWSKINLREAEKIANLGRNIFGWKSFRKIEYILGFLLTQELSMILNRLNELDKIALTTFHPKWFVDYCIDLFGKNQGISFLRANNDSPPDYIRLNTIKGSKKEILERLTIDGVELKKVRRLKHSYEIIKTEKPLTKIDSFQSGLFYIQDKASTFATEIANPKAGDTVLDVCSAPGTKTSYLAQLMKNQGNIYSIDYSKRRNKTWKSVMKHMGVKNAFPILADVCISIPLRVLADIIILDPPCTSTGVFSKHPSAKWRLSRKSIKKMAEIQLKMINNCADKVKSKGSIIYSTCSVTTEENEEIIEKFLKHNSNFILSKIEPKIGLSGLKGLEECQRFYPNIHRSNGFFIAKIIKK